MFWFGKTLFAMLLVTSGILAVTNHFELINSSTLATIKYTETKLELVENTIGVHSASITIIIASMLIVGSLCMMAGLKSGWFIALLAYLILTFVIDCQFLMKGEKPSEVNQIYILKHISIVGAILLAWFK